MLKLSKNFRKNLATDLRKRGYSYSEIKDQISVPKSTLSSWFKDLELTESQTQKLKERQIRIAKENLKKRILKTSQEIEWIRESAMKDIKKISKRELWLMGIVLYWRERFLLGHDDDLKKGLRFTSSDPNLIKLFLKWLKEIGKIKNEEITFDIFIQEKDKDSIDNIVKYWSQLTDYPREEFKHIYFHKSRLRKTKKNILKKSQFGLLRIRVRASSMLARQISGWVKGIERII